MAHGPCSILTWEKMKILFTNKYQEYCKEKRKKTRVEILYMIQGEDLSLDEYAKKFHFSYKRSTNYRLEDVSLKLIKGHN